MRTPSSSRRPALYRLIMSVALTALAAGVLPAAAEAAPSPRAGRVAAAPTWSLVGTLDTQHLVSPTTVLHFYGVYWIGAQGAFFHPLIPSSINQVAVPNVRMPAAGTYTYRLVVRVRASTEPMRFQVDQNPPVTVAPGQTTFEHIQTVQTPNENWWTWVIRNADNASWLFYACDIYLQTG